MGQWTHRITRYDESTQTCSECGEQPLKIKGGRPKCRTMVASWKGKHRGYTTRFRSSILDHCEICESKNNLVGDHDHETMEFRGTLCGACNKAIGLMQDDPSRLLAAVGYLNQFS